MLATLDSQFAADVLAGLRAPIPAIPARWFYDERGSELFDDITRLPSYYPSRTETALLDLIMPEVAEIAGPGRAVVEWGAGSLTKTPILLETIRPSVYVPIDISGAYLRHSARELRGKLPWLEIIPVEADFAREVTLPEAIQAAPKLGFFPGSTIGNFVPRSATDLLRGFRAELGTGALLLIGMDRVKRTDRLIAAYDDPAGVTAAFNLNLLARINRELDGTIRIQDWRHEARWNDIMSRVEMHLVAVRDTAFDILGERFSFARDESIHTENSHKYGPRGARLQLLSGGWTPIREWTDPAGDFAVILTRAEAERFAP